MTRDHTYVITKVILHARGFGIARAIARAAKTTTVERNASHDHGAERTQMEVDDTLH